MEHDEYNPYTAVERSPSQHFICVPAAPPVQETYIHLVQLTPFDLANIALTKRLAESKDTPDFTHPYITPQEFAASQLKVSKCEGVLTVTDIEKLKDPFERTGSELVSGPVVGVHPPNDVTIHKTAFTSESLADLADIHVAFPSKGSVPPTVPVVLPNRRPTSTINKKMLSPESMYELEQTNGHFGIGSNDFEWKEETGVYGGI
ncbi:unnamed protein product [Caenorhabditis sp. 36 PRJEB53466]|nr:unnamed protein product [Caenorhabditis sp. 36 PRJEB53466]